MVNNRILVVGGAGYIGTHMVKRLLQEGCGVITLDNLSTGHRELLPGGEFIQGDFGDRALLDEIFKRKVDAVMHFGALALVGESVENPLKYYENNFTKSAVLFEAMIRNGVNRVIFSSSAAVYGEPQEIPIQETHLCNPVNPYGTSKLMVEKLLLDCDRAYGLKSISLRYFNAAGADESGTIGELHEPETHLIPLILMAASGRKKAVNIFGTDYSTKDGTAVRDYIHVNDLVAAHMLALEALMDGKPTTTYNLGNGKGYSVREIVDAARNVTGKEISAIETDRRPGDPAVLVASAEKIKRDLGWQCNYADLMKIIGSAWGWYKHFGSIR